MEAIIYYLFEYGLYIVAFYLLYIVLFKGKNDHQFNRFYLTSSSIICLLIPLLPNNFFSSNNAIFGVILEPIQIGAKGTAQLISEGNESIPIIAVLALLYLGITFILAMRFLYGILKIQSYIQKGQKTVYKNNFIVESNEISVPFSFFNHIYLPASNYTQEEKELIVEHEMTHIKFGHSFEKILFLINKVLFWWNPISHQYFKELELVHEYQVDEKLCEISGKKEYSQFLLSQFNTNSQYTFVNNISSHIKNRIIMISSKNKSLPTLIKWGSYFTLFFGVLFLHSCTADDEPLIEDNYRQYETVKSSVTPTGDFETVEYTDTVTVFNTETQEESVRIVQWTEDVYKTPEVMPVFGDCGHINNVEEKYECSNQKLLEYIYKNLSYPKEAKDNGVEGMNVVEFVVTSTGHVASEKYIRSIGHGTNEAIQKVIDKMKKEKGIWTAGRQDGETVATRFTMPIKFKLEG